MNFRWIFGTAAQILLLFILIPFGFGIFSILGGITGNGIGSGVEQWLSNFPMFEIWLNIFEAYSLRGTTPEQFLTLTLWAYGRAFSEAVMVSIVVHITNVLYKGVTEGDNPRILGANILPCFIGIFLTSLLISFFGLAGDMTALFMEIGSIVIMLFGFRILLSGRVEIPIFSLTTILTFVVDGLLAVIACGYVTKLVLIFEDGPIPSPSEVKEFLLFSVYLFVAAVLSYFVNGFEDTQAFFNDRPWRR